MPLVLKSSDERLRQVVPIGIGIYAARPASPRGSATRMINVLSEPHLPSDESLESNLNNAVTSLQKTLDKSDTRVFNSYKFDGEGSETLQPETSSLGSGSSIRVAASAARVIVAGLFGRQKRSAASLSDGKSEVSKSPTSSSLSGRRNGDSDEEYLYTNAVHPPPHYTLSRRKNRKMPPPRQDPPAYTNFPHFESSSSSISTIRKRPLTPIQNAGAKEAQSKEGRRHYFSPLTLTQSRCDRIKAGAGINHRKSHASRLRKPVQDVFMGTDENQNAAGSSGSAVEIQRASRRTSFCSPARALIRQSSTCSSLSKLTDFPAASPRREGSIHGSGRAALTSVLTNPGFGKVPSRKVTSLTVCKSSWPIPDSRVGYVSFPSFIPSASQYAITNLFGRNDSSTSLVPDTKGIEKPHEIPAKPALRRTWMGLAPRMRKTSGSTVGTGIE